MKYVNATLRINAYFSNRRASIMPITGDIISLHHPHELIELKKIPKLVYLDNDKNPYIQCYRHSIGHVASPQGHTCVDFKMITAKVLIEALSENGQHKLANIEIYDVSCDNMIYLGKTDNNGFFQLSAQKDIPFTFLLNPNTKENAKYFPIQTLTRVFGEGTPTAKNTDSGSAKLEPEIYRNCSVHLPLRLPTQVALEDAQPSTFRKQTRDTDLPVTFKIKVQAKDRAISSYDEANMLTPTSTQHRLSIEPKLTKDSIEIPKIEALQSGEIKKLEVRCDSAKMLTKVQLNPSPWFVLSHELKQRSPVYPMIVDTLRFAISHQGYPNDEIDTEKLMTEFQSFQKVSKSES